MNTERHFILQGTGPDGNRTSVSVHAVLAQKAIDRYPDYSDFVSDVRRMIASGNDSWAVSALLIQFIADPKQTSLFKE